MYRGQREKRREIGEEEEDKEVEDRKGVNFLPLDYRSLEESYHESTI